MKYEWRKNDKELYLPKTEPAVIDVGEYPYFALCGSGNPNSEAFAEAIGVLYSLSYAVKMMPKKGTVPEGYYGLYCVSSGGRLGPARQILRQMSRSIKTTLSTRL